MAQRAHTPEPAVAPPPGNPRFPLFDGLRAIAALSIVVTHTAALTTFNSQNVLGAWTARLDAGVAVFFVISGFLLYRPFVQARLEGTERPGFGRFWWRRALRILPAYWLALLVLSIWPGLPGFPGDEPWRYLLLVQNFDQNTITGGIGTAWSLCVEVEFYLVLPFLALGAARVFGTSRRGMTAELTFLAVLAAASIAARSITHAGDEDATLPYTLLGFFAWFAPGMALAVLSAHWHAARHTPGWARWLGAHAWLSWLAAFAVLTAATRIGLPRTLNFRFTEANWFGEHVLYGLFGAFVVLPAVIGAEHDGVPQRVLRNRVVAWLGLVSYGIFLYHLPIAPEFYEAQNHAIGSSFITYTLVVAGVATAFAAASYYAVERPILRLKDIGRARSRPAAEPAR